MRLRLWAISVAGSMMMTPVLGLAQYSQGPQPYNSQDPQNYGAPATQSYYGGQQEATPAPVQTYDTQAQYQAQEQVYQAPPALPQYDQSEAPGEDYIWTPGYWAFGRGGYYWMPGAWVLAPYDGALWTPGYWGFAPSQYYFWNAGYWGPSVGFYGGINYGFGYFGTGFYGGYWREHHFCYNREYWNGGFGSNNYYNQRYAGFERLPRDGRSFTTLRAPRGLEQRGGTYAVNGSRGNAGLGQAQPGHPAYPSNGFAGNSGNTAISRAPQQGNGQEGVSQRQPYAGRPEAIGGSYPRPSMPTYQRPTTQTYQPSMPTYQHQPQQQTYQQHGQPTYQHQPQQTYQQPSQSYSRPSMPSGNAPMSRPSMPSGGGGGGGRPMSGGGGGGGGVRR